MSPVTALLVLSAFSVVAGVLVAARTLYRARGVPRTLLQFAALGSAIFCIAVGVTLFYGGRQVQSQMQGIDALRGAVAPVFRYQLNKGVHSTAEWRGKPVLFNLWATWCEPCREELRTLSKIQSDVYVVALSDEDPKVVEAFLKANPYDMPTGTIVEGAPRIPARPVTMAIDAAGIVRDIKVGALDGSEIEAMLAAARK